MRSAVALVLGLVLLAICAKAHGRQVRLRREQEGHLDVDFRKDNHPWVEALWRRDRWILWGSATVLAAAVAALVVAGAVPAGMPGSAASLALALMWCVCGGFLVAAAAAAVAAARAPRPLPQRAWRGSAAWLALVFVVAGMQVLVLALAPA